MKLALALSERADLQRRLSELGGRLNRNAKVREGDKQDEWKWHVVRNVLYIRGTYCGGGDIMIFVTGDMHGDVRRLSSKSFPFGKKLSKGDYVVVCGDFGLIWDSNSKSAEERYWLDWLNDRPFTTLFVDGNHENHERLDAYNVEKWNGGKIHRVKDTVIHLMRGQTYKIQCGTGIKTLFTFGGAQSHDIRDGVLDPVNDKEKIKEWERNNRRNDIAKKQFRVLGESWWPHEMPTNDEMQEGVDNLDKVDWKVDYIFTHDCCGDIKRALGFKKTDQLDNLNSYFNLIFRKCEYERWFFGHYHMDLRIGKNNFLLYETIINSEDKL